MNMNDVERLRDRLERTKDRLDSDMNTLRAAALVTSLQLSRKKRESSNERRGDNADASHERHRGRAVDLPEMPERRTSLLDSNMLAFSKNVTDRRASSVLSTSFNATIILEKQAKEETDSRHIKPNLRQILMVDDKYRDALPVLKNTKSTDDLTDPRERKTLSEHRARKKAAAEQWQPASEQRFRRGSVSEQDPIALPTRSKTTLESLGSRVGSVDPKARHTTSYRRILAV